MRLFHGNTRFANSITSRIIRLSLILPALIAAVTSELAAQASSTHSAKTMVDVIESGDERIVLHYVFEAPTIERVAIGGREHIQISMEGESVTLEAGAPALPRVCRSVIIPDDAEMAVKVLNVKEYTIEGVNAAPSKGRISRSESADAAPYIFDGAYSKDGDYPGSWATLREPYIMRDFRGVVVELNPVQYNPKTHTLRICSEMTVELVNVGPGKANVLDRARRGAKVSRAFDSIYAARFVNYRESAATRGFDENGEMLIVVPSGWRSIVTPLAELRTAQGIPTTVGIPCGLTVEEIHAYLKELYETTNLTYVLLVGDWIQTPTPPRPFWGYSDAAADPVYALTAGDDPYPDILVGRMSANTSAQVYTQIQRTIAYDTECAVSQDWFMRASGIASDMGPGHEGESDAEHIENIRTDLLNYGYTSVDRFYAPEVSGAEVVGAINAGRGFINYCGTASRTSWVDAWLNAASINGLQNTGKLPFIVSAAGMDGAFSTYDDPSDCMAEAWMRATDGGLASGAIGVYAASAFLDWNPPMTAQDEIVDLLTSETYSTFGALCYAGACRMIDDYGEVGADNFYIWCLFGDPSVRVVRTSTDEGEISLDRAAYQADAEVQISIADRGLDLDGTAVETFAVTINSDSNPGGETVLLTETRTNSGLFTGTIALSDAGDEGALLVAENDVIAAEYIDADDGQGGVNIVRTATATIDGAAPTILDVRVTTVERRRAIIEIDANEPVSATVHYGLNCAETVLTAVNDDLSTTAVVEIADLSEETAYNFIVEAADAAGNSTIADDEGDCYGFVTLDGPDYFTEEYFWDFDLSNTSITFSPGLLEDGYTACVESIDELPSDPTGGVTLELSDDSFVGILLHEHGLSPLVLYGNAYDHIFVHSNGYIEFSGFGSDGTETLEEHFRTPRICGLWNDLNVDAGGAVIWTAFADHVAVTFDEVPEYASWIPENSNTFQIECFFDGTIRLSYLDMTAACGIVGISAGGYLPGDFMESDLSALRDCGMQPPLITLDTEVEAPAGRPTTILLQAYDDGLPNPPAALSYAITSLPSQGTLTDPGADYVITAADLPYTLVDHGDEVIYVSVPAYDGTDSFRYLANDGGTPPTGGDSNEGDVYIDVSIGLRELIHSCPLDEDPGWSFEGDWAFGAPTGGGSHGGDPFSGYTGDYVYGYNLNGDYPADIPEPQYLTTAAFDCSELVNVELRYRRWLGVANHENATALVEMSNDGVEWTRLWSNWSTCEDHSWQLIDRDLSPVADGRSTVYVRWSMGPMVDARTYCGWNIDDVEIWGTYVGAPCPGDLNHDRQVTLGDLATLLANYGDAGGVVYEDGDIDNNDIINLADLAALLAHYGEICP